MLLHRFLMVGYALLLPPLVVLALEWSQMNAADTPSNPSQALLPSDTLVQYVCFATVLPQPVFQVIWKPFANGFLRRGLRHIVLASAQATATTPAKYRFISRNLWPSAAYLLVARNDLVGDGGSGPVMADQGGVFRLFAGSLTGLERQQSASKLMLLLKAKGHAPNDGEALANAVVNVSNVLLAALAGPANTAVAVRSVVLIKAWPEKPQRFDVIAEFYLASANVGQLSQALGEALEQQPAVMWSQSHIAHYQETITLP
jgi:hypothetical protein